MSSSESSAPSVRTHCARLRRLLTLEEAEERDELQRLFGDLTPAERQQRGQALLDLILVEERYTIAGHTLLVFARADDQPLPLFSLDVGDLVVILPATLRDTEWPTATVYEKTTNTLAVACSSKLPEWIADEPRFQLQR